MEDIIKSFQVVSKYKEYLFCQVLLFLLLFFGQVSVGLFGERRRLLLRKGLLGGYIIYEDEEWRIIFLLDFDGSVKMF